MKSCDYMVCEQPRQRNADYCTEHDKGATTTETRKAIYHSLTWEALVESGWTTHHIDHVLWNGLTIKVAVMVK